MVRLGDICKFQSGGTPSKSNPDYFGGTIPWITTIALTGNIINETNAVQWITPKAIQETAAKIVSEYSIMVGTRVGVGKVAINSVPMSTSQDVVSLINIDSERWDKEYLCKLILSRNNYLLSQARGATIKGIKIDILAELIIPDVPLSEQRRIAATLDKVSDLISKRRQQLDKLDELVKARFVEMFGNFIYEHDRWKICEVGDIADTIDPHPSHRTPPISANGVPYIGIADCDYTTKQINFETARKVGYNVLQEHIKRYTLSNGDFIIGKIGTIGKPFMVPAKQSYTLSANTVLIKPTKEKIAPEFLFAVFQSEYMDRIIDAEKKSTSQPAFGIQKVRKIAIPLPPMELQKQFAIFSDQTDKVKVTISHSLEKLETLKKALMQEYFGTQI